MITQKHFIWEECDTIDKKNMNKHKDPISDIYGTALVSGVVYDIWFYHWIFYSIKHNINMWMNIFNLTS